MVAMSGPDLTWAMRGIDALLDRSAIERYKRNHVRRSYSWMNAFMTAYVDQFGGAAGSANRSFDHCIGRAGEGNYAAIMVAIHL